MILGVLLIMVKGIGVDLIDNIRFEKLIKSYGNKVALKILSKSEYLEYIKASSKNTFLAKKFAAKEALSKAIGSGLYRNGIFPKLISISHTSLGKPFFEFFDIHSLSKTEASRNLIITIKFAVENCAG